MGGVCRDVICQRPRGLRSRPAGTQRGSISSGRLGWSFPQAVLRYGRAACPGSAGFCGPLTIEDGRIPVGRGWPHACGRLYVEADMRAAFHCPPGGRSGGIWPPAIV